LRWCDPVVLPLKRKSLQFLERCFGKGEISPQEINFDVIQRILVVRQHDQLGDFLLSTPVLRALRERFPDAHITLVVREYTSAAALHNQYIDDVLVFYEVGYRWNWKRLRYFWQRLRKGFDLAIVLNTVSHSLTSDLLAYFSRAPYILGPSFPVLPGTSHNFFYNLLAPVQNDDRHQSEKNLDIVRYLGMSTSDLSENMHLLPQEKEWAKEYLQNAGVAFSRLLVGLHPGAGKPGNRWSAANFARVGDYFAKQYGAEIVLFYGPKELKLAELVQKHIHASVHVIAGLNLRRLAAIFSQLNLLICNDTGTTHLAAAVGTPLVAIFGPTDARQWKPLGKNCVAVQGQNGVCDTVSVQEVILAAERLLQETSFLNKICKLD